MAELHTGKKVCVTGGHLSPAVAVIEEILASGKPWTVVFAGRAKTSRSSVFASEEKQCIEQLHIPFFPLHAGRLSRTFSWDALYDALTIPVGFVEAIVFCLREKPDCILSFGGYVGLPVVIAGWLFGIPTVIHEQTHRLGLANAIASEFAQNILLTFPDARKQQDKRVRVTGLPLRKSFFSAPAHASFPIPAKKPVLYITGGTTGAVSMNDLLFPCIGSLVHDYTVIHQTGQQSYAKALTVLDTLPKDDKPLYIPTPYVESGDVSWIMHHARLVIGRSGANTVAEVAALNKSAVFIPLPWAGSQEQLRNATWYAAASGNVHIVNQQRTTSDQLCEIIRAAASHADTTSDTQHHAVPAAARAIVDTLALLM